MKPLALALILTVLASPAAAHRLKLFATVEGAEVTGYAYFVGGGRAQGSDWTARDVEGAEIASGRTDPDGRYRFTPPAPVTGPIRVTVDTHEGHVATAEITPERFAPPNPGSVLASPTPLTAGNPGSVLTPRAAPVVPAGPSLPINPGSVLAPGARPVLAPMPPEEIAPLVEAAVQRQVAPLLERIEQMDARMRVTDVVSGLFLIIGLAGAALYLRGRRG
ncbi:cobalamin biosynthesis protein CbiL [Paenirhodobacter sp.]|uniref:cobalamin biosynthesis protein CbiL n=1 Tax=Paenirhodobacter sp. TaxID=1965326 RepID=UPI003B40275F